MPPPDGLGYRPSWVLTSGLGVAATLAAVLVWLTLFWPSTRPRLYARTGAAAGTGSTSEPGIDAGGRSRLPGRDAAGGVVLGSPQGQARPLRYNWRVGDRHVYDFSVVADTGGSPHTSAGECAYWVKAIASTPSDEACRATGSAFVVDADGYLVTCAHVIQDAARVLVRLGDRQWPAEVVAYNTQQDLALLRVQATGLPSLDLSPTDVELNQSVSVVGFPLSDLLGKGVKMTSGAVSGACEHSEQGGERFQLDASVNPGNSGGPVIDRYGRVVGVASALLSGLRIDEVAFATPVSEVRKLLAAASVEPSTRRRPKRANGPALARMVTPAVASVDVTLSVTALQTYRVQYRASCRSDGALGGASPARESGEFVVDCRGNISQFQGKAALPVQLDSLGTLVFEPLGESGQRRWRRKSTSQLNVGSGGLGVPGRVAPRRWFGFRQQEDNQEVYPAVEDIRYEVVGESPTTFTVEKRYRFETTRGAPPKLLQTGSGKWEFDREAGVPSRFTFQATAEYDGRDQTPYTIRFARRVGTSLRRSVSTVEEHAALAAGGSPVDRPTRGPRGATRTRTGVRQTTVNLPARTPTTAPTMTLDQALAALRRPAEDNRVADEARLQQAAQAVDALARIEFAPQRQAETAKALIDYLTGRHVRIASEELAHEATARWMTATQAKRVAQAIVAPGRFFDHMRRRLLVESLRGRDTPEVRRALLAMLGDTSAERAAREGLVAIGPEVEMEVAEVLKSNSGRARRNAVRVLQEIGSPAILPELRAAAADRARSLLYRTAITELIARLERRG